MRSITNKIDQFRLHFEQSNIDFITVSETWLSKEISRNILQLEGYQLFRSDRLQIGDNNLAKRGGGLMIYIRSEVNFTPTMKVECNISDQHCELQRIELCNGVQKNIVIYNVYRPPSGHIEPFIEHLTHVCENEQNVVNKEIIFMGDFNINYTAKKQADSKKLISWQNRLGLSQKIKSLTRVSKNSGSIIDLIFTNIEHCSASGTIDLHISDHVPVYLIKKKEKDSRARICFRGRTYVGYSKDLLSDELNGEVKTKFRNSLDPNECWDLMLEFLNSFLNRFCPLKTFRSKDNTPAWVTNDILILSKDRDSAWKLAKLTGNDEDWARARRLRNWANNAIKSAKSDFVTGELNDNVNNPKKFWRNIKDVLPDDSSGSINIANSLTNETLPKSQQAQVINDFFAGIGHKLASKFEAEELINVNDFHVEPAGESLIVDHIDQVVVLKLIDTISVNKSSGIDNISSRVLKDFMILASREITHLYNLILDTGLFPTKWKIASVTPIPKVSTATNPSDLRPISILPVPGKLLEKFITQKIESYLEENRFFSECQYGFRKGKSTTGAMSTFLDDIICNLNDSQTCLTAYLDVQKAFDTINHRILLAKLKSCGMGEKLCTLLKDYLSNRKQKTRLHNSISDLKPIEIGVPQGSTLGPLMFIIYVNDLPDVLEHSKVLMYADDTVLYFSSNSCRQARKRLQSDLNNVQQWCLRHRLSLNVSKTKIMSFMSDHKRRLNKVPFKLYMKGREIELVDTYKYLGIHIDCRLNGDAQFTKSTQTLGYKLRTFGKIRRFLTTSAALSVYKSTILPIIDYCDLFQNLWNVDKLNKLQRLQNWGLRLVYTGRGPLRDETELHTVAKLTILKWRRYLHLMCMMYRRSKCANYLDKRDLPTRQFDKIKFKVINPLVKKAFRSPNYLGSLLWDMLPLDTQTAPTYNIFKYKTKRHIAAGLLNNLRHV